MGVSGAPPDLQLHDRWKTSFLWPKHSFLKLLSLTESLKKIKILDKNLIESLGDLNINSEEIHSLKINWRITEDKQTYKFYGLIHIC